MDRPDLQYFAYAVQYEGTAELVGGSASSGGGTSNSILSVISNSISSPVIFNELCPQLQLRILALYPEQSRGIGGAWSMLHKSNELPNPVI